MVEMLFVIGGILVGGLLIVAQDYKNMKAWFLRRNARKLLKKSLDDVTVIQTEFMSVELPNLHRALEVWGQQTDDSFRIVHRVGIPQVRFAFDALREAKLMPSALRFQMMQIGPRKRVRVPISAMYFATYKDQGVLIWNEQGALFVAGGDESVVEEVLEKVRKLSRQHSCYRGQVLSVVGNSHYDYDYDYGGSGISLQFHELESVDEAMIVLPDETISLLRRSTLDFFRVSDRLISMGQPGNRGLLLHGPPGTGKTLVTRWLIGHLPEVTKFLLTGQQLVHLDRTVRLARMLRPSLLILDDVDLIGTHREANPYGSVLHDLMNLMDGLERQDQVMFILTTNRPDTIESALADRPGRIDQAILFPLPDAECRRRLIDLFAGEQSLEKLNLPRWVHDTDRTTPAFLRELVRRSTQCAIVRCEQNEQQVELHDCDFQAALADMTSGGGSLTKRLLGFSGDS